MTHAAMELPDALLRHARSNGIVVMAGAGVSAAPPSSLPDWFEINRLVLAALCERLETYLERPRYTDDTRNAIDARRTADRFPPDYQAQILEEACGEHYFRALQSLDVDATNEAHRAIAWLAKHGVVRAVVTTNFDRLVEKALDAYDVPCDVAFDPPTYARCLATLTAGASAVPVQVLKVHGSVEDHRSLIDTLKQRLRGRNDQLDACMVHLLERYFWVYGGFSAADLETDDAYLHLLPSAEKSPGLVYLQWPRSKAVRPGAAKLLNAYAQKGSKVVAEVPEFLTALGRALALPAQTTGHNGNATGGTKAEVTAALARWAASLHPAAAVNCVAGLAEASGQSEQAFRLLHRFWKDVDPRDRSGVDFELYRLYHGRLGMGAGLLSVVDDLQSTAGEESLQNLLRRAHAGDPRAKGWAGVALIWAARLDLALPLIEGAGNAFVQADRTPEERLDAYQACAEALYVLGEPEGFFQSFRGAATLATRSGELAREAKLTALAALFCAEWAPEKFPAFWSETVEPVHGRARRLNDPAISGFAELARGRYLTKQRDGPGASAALSEAALHLQAAGRPPWQIVASIESAKALLDQRNCQRSADLLNTVNAVIDRYQVLLPWLEEAGGQWHQCCAGLEDARPFFERAVDYATRMNLKRRAKALRQYLAPAGLTPDRGPGAAEDSPPPA
jgi:hypothetical protein